MLRRHPCALLLPTLLGIGFSSGCSMTQGAKTASRPDIKTIASVGDQPLPATRGEPGSSVVSGDLDPPPKRDPKTKISGRVLDEDGKPVVGAIVRPADGSVSAGRVVQATTDAAGGFTLHGLRAGTGYTLVAEYETDEGVKVGRIDTRSSETDVEIAIEGLDGRTRVGSSRDAAKARSVSDRYDVDDEEIPPPLKSKGKAPSPVNLDDIPTSEEVEAGAASDLDRPRPDAFRKSPTSGWKGRGDVRVGSASSAPSARPASSRNDLDAPPADEARAVRSPSVPEEDGDNPLPPAIDPTESSRPSKTDTSAVRRAAPVAVGLAAAERAASLDSGGLRLAQPEAAPARPVTWDQADALAANNPAPAAASTAAPRPRPANPPAAPPAEAAAVARKVTWGEVEPPKTPTATATNPSPARVATGAATAPTVSAVNRGSPPRMPAGSESIRYDARNRKLTDFRLPDTEGRLVSFQDFDADYILLDFWGSWCRPCVESVPKLVEMQKRFGNARVQIVGIACEKGTFDQRAQKASVASNRLGVNYPVLVSSTEEFSPVQNAFKIKSFPTLILVDKQGNVVWREQGAAPNTLAALDRVIASSVTPGLGSETLRR